VTNGSYRVIYITPEKEHSCPHNTQLCYILSHIAENPMNYFSSNTTIIFLPGNHTIDTNRSITIANVSNITLEGSGSTIQCIKGRELGFVFIQVTNLSISNLHLHQCGAMLPLEVELELYKTTLSELVIEYFYTKSSPVLYFIDVINITISRVSIYYSTGPGLLGFNVIGHSTISQSSFVRNNPNCALLFTDTTSFTPGLQSVELSMFDSKCLLGRFVHNQTADTEILLTHPTAAGLRALMAQMSYKLSLNIINVLAMLMVGLTLQIYCLTVYCNNSFKQNYLQSLVLHRIGFALIIRNQAGS